MRLSEISNWIVTAVCRGDEQTIITGLANDSGTVQAGDLFFCISGARADGHHYANQAAAAGAVALVVERELEIPLPQVIVNNARHALAMLATAWNHFPSHSLHLIGITGTNGKTTTAYLIEQILNDAQRKTGVISTIQLRYGHNIFPMSNTTPDVLLLQKSLSDMVKEEVVAVAMEVSSHALVQGRVQGCKFRIAVFTNLSQDHLDYHETMAAYREAKGLFFSRLGNTFADIEQERSYAVLNADDKATPYFTQLTTVETITYGLSERAHVRATNVQLCAQGTMFTVHTFRGIIDIRLRMIGKFNVYNALAAITVGLLEGLELSDIKHSLQMVTGVAGRVELVTAGQPFTVIVDYAHTPDGLENVLQTITEFATGRIIVVFGCGGDRDRMKRPLMGKIAAQYANYSFVTSDNPRTENPVHILQHIVQGMVEVDQSRYTCIVDRQEAITKAIAMAKPQDVILIAGKGHETYQIIGQETIPFDDRLVAKVAIRSRFSV